MPQAVGEAKVSGEQGYMNVEAKFDKFAAASSSDPVPHLRPVGRHT